MRSDKCKVSKVWSSDISSFFVFSREDWVGRELYNCQMCGKCWNQKKTCFSLEKFSISSHEVTQKVANTNMVLRSGEKLRNITCVVSWILATAWPCIRYCNNDRLLLDLVNCLSLVFFCLFLQSSFSQVEHEEDAKCYQTCRGSCSPSIWKNRRTLLLLHICK